ncbi:hypothetical protein L3V79_09550 [Thiotrichales bacterium 19S9-12]|nr:hypothetical protein [Thiotrichales bacterium 19S9-11]MCF6812601.1 hypothetical protein [Thiotrichales bacterium 19S9-12]
MKNQLNPLKITDVIIEMGVELYIDQVILYESKTLKSGVQYLPKERMWL